MYYFETEKERKRIQKKELTKVQSELTTLKSKRLMVLF
jgi:hypothetical protein